MVSQAILQALRFAEESRKGEESQRFSRSAFSQSRRVAINLGSEEERGGKTFHLDLSEYSTKIGYYTGEEVEGWEENFEVRYWSIILC